jgi:hypothetical protein
MKNLQFPLSKDEFHLSILYQVAKLFVEVPLKYCRISRLNRIKKIDAHKNVTITTEKYIKLQEF